MSGSTIPVIDIGPLMSGDADSEQDVARRIGEACRTIGFFYIVGHGVSQSVIDGIFETMMTFFQQPVHVKREGGFVSNRGYVQLGGEALDPNKPGDLKEAFNIGLELDTDDVDLGTPFRALNIWSNIPNFKNLMLDYYDQMRHIGITLHRAFAMDLGIEPTFFVNQFRKPMATLRLLHYPPIEQPLMDGQMGAGVHTDYGNVTILKTDTVGGLMVQTRDGQWLDAPVIADAFVCNIGDCLMRWTNDIYVSTPHKVVSPKGRDRYSVAFFFDPDPDSTVSCLPTCSGPDRPSKYPPVTAADYLMSRLNPTYAHPNAS
jgi:isopenicillin N synthase-like dioxygenase